jgi:hypothetical protein
MIQYSTYAADLNTKIFIHFFNHLERMASESGARLNVPKPLPQRLKPVVTNFSSSTFRYVAGLCSKSVATLLQQNISYF